MKDSQLDIYTKFSTAQTNDELWSSLHTALADYGVTSVFYGFAHSLKLAEAIGNKAAMYHRTSHPASLGEYYQHKNYHYINDSLPVLHCAVSTRSFLWHKDEEWENATYIQKHMRQVNSSIGLEAGVSIPLRFSAPHGIGGIGIATGGLEPFEFDKLWNERQNEIKNIVYGFDMLTRKEHLDEIFPLTNREKETLQWLAVLGSPACNIGRKMGVEDTTVRTHLTSACKKLKVHRPEQAMVKALVLEIISL